MDDLVVPGEVAVDHPTARRSSGRPALGAAGRVNAEKKVSTALSHELEVGLR
jgi:hypothetical protein